MHVQKAKKLSTLQYPRSINDDPAFLILVKFNRVRSSLGLLLAGFYERSGN